jgi:DNA end-binding protein Ku
MTEDMAARAMWKGVITFGQVQVPVRLYAAVQDRDIHFRLLHGDDLVPVRQEMVNPQSGEIVPYENIKRAYEDDDVLVILHDEDLAALEPKASRDIEVLRFVDKEDITEQWYDRPYYLAPDRSNGSYFALAEAMRKQNKIGVARWTMRKKEYSGALIAEDGHLMLVTLRHADEVIPATALEPPAGRKPDPKELKLAEQLVGALEADFDPEEFKDEYRERVLDFVKKKAKGKTPTIRKLRPKKETAESLSNVLARSIKAASKERKRA